MLSERLPQLEQAGIIAKEIYGTVPPRVEYKLTDRAQELVLILNDLCVWDAGGIWPQYCSDLQY